jgi:hypothetical protein
VKSEDCSINADNQEISEQHLYIKIHRSGREVLVAVCDSELMGKRFDDGNLHIEIKDDFFGDEKVNVMEIEKALASATIANMVGERAVECAVKLGYISKENILMIKGIPCAQMVLM